MELNDALSRIAQIREQIARTQRYHGYRAHTTAFTGVVAIAASVVQAWWHPVTILAFLGLWLVAAALSLAVVITEMVLRQSRSGSDLQREQTIVIAGQFLPCLVAGGLLTFVFVRCAEGALWLLPGLWSILFSLGVFASRTVLPRGIGLVGLYYLLAGLLAIGWPMNRSEFSPWQMIGTFGVGQLLAAGVLWWSCERKNRGDDAA